MRLLIVSHTPHYRAAGQLVGWGPTVRELDHLAELFAEVVHVAPVYDGQAPGSALAYTSSRVRLRPVNPAGGETLRAKLDIARLYPAYAAAIRDELRHADAVHVRCPANISLLALALLHGARRPGPRWVKYAGNWQPDGAEPWSYAVQRRWLAANYHRGVVTVNGQWPDQPPHVYTFHNPSLTEAELAAGRRAAADKRLTQPLELLFVGALNDAKGVGRVLQVALALRQQDVPYRLRLLGDGPDRPRYESWAADHSLRDIVFHGWVPPQAVGRFNAAAHFILHPSLSEGWPKVLSEAMAYGVVPVASAVSSMPQILAATGAGVACPVEDIDGLTAAIVNYVNNPAEWQAASRAGVAAAPQFGYRAYQAAVADLFRRAWGIELKTPSPTPATLAGVAPTLHATNGHVKH
jgi:glycosyltransferase involved in cell wall biosynthesis